MKTFLAATLLLSFSALAQIPHPTDLILDAEPASLRLIGKKLMKGSISVKSCVFENEKVVVVYGNCTARKEAPATSIKILSKSGGMLSLYIENSDAMEKRGAISTHPRSNYDRSWSVSFKSTPAVMSSDIDAIDTISSGNYDLCYTSADLQPLPGTPEFGKSKSACTGELGAELGNWRSLGLEFWQEPGPDWYQFLRNMRALTSRIP